METGGCPHTAICEDASINLAADLRAAFPDLDLILIESGGDSLAATFSPELADLTIYLIDTAAGQDIPRKRGPGVARSDLLVVNKTDLAPYVGVDLAQHEADTKVARGTRPYVMARLRQGEGVNEVVAFLVGEGGWCYQTPGPDIHADRRATVLSEEKFSYENFSGPKIFRTKNLYSAASRHRDVMRQGAALPERSQCRNKRVNICIALQGAGGDAQALGGFCAVSD